MIKSTHDCAKYCRHYGKGTGLCAIIPDGCLCLIAWYDHMFNVEDYNKLKGADLRNYETIWNKKKEFIKARIEQAKECAQVGCGVGESC